MTLKLVCAPLLCSGSPSDFPLLRQWWSSRAQTKNHHFSLTSLFLLQPTSSLSAGPARITFKICLRVSPFLTMTIANSVMHYHRMMRPAYIVLPPSRALAQVLCTGLIFFLKYSSSCVLVACYLTPSQSPQMSPRWGLPWPYCLLKKCTFNEFLKIYWVVQYPHELSYHCNKIPPAHL